MIGAMSKWSQSAQSYESIPELLHHALRVCWTGRPGVVHLDVPENLINGDGPALALPPPQAYRRVAPIEPADDAVERAAELLATARLPMIHAGSGVLHAQASDALARVATALHAPVTASWGARGALEETSPLSWPMVHVEACTHLRNEADLVLCVGSDLGETDWWGKAPYWAPTTRQRWIQVDIDDAILGRNRPLELGVLADARVFLERLAASRRSRDAVRRATSQCGGARRGEDEDRAALDSCRAAQQPMVTVHAATICREVFEDAIKPDGGNASVWGQFYSEIRVPIQARDPFRPPGAGVGQAGCRVAHPGRQVYCPIGDGAMAFQMQSLRPPCAPPRADLAVCCDRQWGMVKINQMFALGEGSLRVRLISDRAGTTNTELGEIESRLAFDGAHGERVSHPDNSPRTNAARLGTLQRRPRRRRRQSPPMAPALYFAMHAERGSDGAEWSFVADFHALRVTRRCSAGWARLAGSGGIGRGGGAAAVWTRRCGGCAGRVARRFRAFSNRIADAASCVLSRLLSALRTPDANSPEPLQQVDSYPPSDDS